MRKLEIGPGKNGRKLGNDWEILQYPGVLPEGDIQHDICIMPWPIRDETYDYILASHVFEHIDYTVQGAIFGECWRILKHGGTLEVHVPDIAKICDAICKRRQLDKKHLSWFEWMNIRVFGGASWSPHRTVYTIEELKGMFGKHGFGNITEIHQWAYTYHRAIDLGIRGEKI